MFINHNVIAQIEKETSSYNAQWIAVTKMRPISSLKELYAAGKKVFGENKAQELCDKYDQLPKDIEWHFIGHLQTNKVKDIIGKVKCIHSADSMKLINTIQKEANKLDIVMHIFIQIHIAKEETKYGFSPEEAFAFFQTHKKEDFPNLKIIGLMAMASFTEDKDQIRKEFQIVAETKALVNKVTSFSLQELSMGMSGDYPIALECGATMVRIGSSLFLEN